MPSIKGSSQVWTAVPINTDAIIDTGAHCCMIERPGAISGAWQKPTRNT